MADKKVLKREEPLQKPEEEGGVVDARTMLEQGRVEEVLRMVDAGELTLHTKEQMDLFRQRARELVNEKLEFELALEEVKTERDTLLKAVVIFHKNFGFFIERAMNASESGKQTPSLFVKMLKSIVGVELPPEAIGMVWSVISEMRQNLTQIKASLPQMGSMLPEILAILRKYDIIPSQEETTKKIEGGQNGQ